MPSHRTHGSALLFRNRENAISFRLFHRITDEGLAGSSGGRAIGCFTVDGRNIRPLSATDTEVRPGRTWRSWIYGGAARLKESRRIGSGNRRHGPGCAAGDMLRHALYRGW